MEALQSKKHIGCIELGTLLFKSSNLGDVEKQFSTRTIVQYKEQFLFILECVIHSDNKRMCNFFQNFPFCPCVSHLLLLPNMFLFEDFHCIIFFCSFFLNKQYLAIGSCAYYRNQSKVILGNFSSSCLSLFDQCLVLLGGMLFLL